MLHTDRGRALAKMRRVSETLTAIGTADDHFAHFTPDNEPPFLACHNPARHALLAGQPLADLAILGRDPGAATERLTVADAGHDDYPRTRAICLTKLASLTMATGDPIHAATIGAAALDAAGTRAMIARVRSSSLASGGAQRRLRRWARVVGLVFTQSSDTPTLVASIS